MATPELKLSNKATDDNRLRVAVEKSNSKGIDFYTHNWCDKTTWYQKSTRVESEAATDTGDQQQFSLANQHVVDTYHGKITQEDDIVDASGNDYRLVLTVNGSGMTEQDPHYGTGGDYTVDYPAGEVNLLSAVPSGADVRATYYYAVGSEFKITPVSGTCLSIEIAEVQFSVDVNITDTVMFDSYGHAGIFAPHLVGPSGLPFDYPIKIKSFIYKTRQDFHNAAFKSYASYPFSTSPNASGNWREINQPVIVYDWDYQHSLSLNYDYGMYIVLRLEHDEVFDGTYATATLYCGEIDLET